MSTIYNSTLADQSMEPTKLVFNRRFWHVVAVLLAYLFINASITITKRINSAKYRQLRANHLRKTLVSLGETFIKLGQFLSTRRDLLPIEIVDELALLQDQVPPFSYKLVRETIKNNLGATPEEIFESFDSIPIASASIGQVHRARLKNGRLVVVKIQRPHLSQRFYQDLGFMRLIIRIGQMFSPNGAWHDWFDLSDQFGQTLFSEIDYLQEGRNADRLRIIMRDHVEIRIPRIYWQHTSRHVLTLEFLPGIKIDHIEALQARGFNLSKLSNQLFTCYLEQVLIHGFFHADPHAGNLSVDEDGKIVIYDFGMMGTITQLQSEAISGCLAAIIQKDAQALIKHLKVLGIVRTNANLAPILRTIEPLMDYYAGKKVRDLDFIHLERDVDKIVFDHSLALPPTLVYLMRAGTALEGITRTLKPNFSFVAAAKSPLLKLVMNQPSQAATLFQILFPSSLARVKNMLFRSQLPDLSI